ncbi:MAG: succinate dehydrogenase/fumarate reductase iron-sulfur subunit [Candidatus Eisenbacteria bacterium]|uniref:succinate dehydrogenase n=1 Tax=Eiseniibacteriota bacterium TaxID=2212470 RepID=A0A956SC17_UNCEI|nr:succinate dehydrogenase/fumarate reductase iron-sulfur subunit [Candidatus Eisenbacteria bacterium]MCB9462578.1 succinate dehydrogenase/fumarate reductase iron-sulfur subunit [Candidatus Eisenbacteria bacterium]
MNLTLRVWRQKGPQDKGGFVDYPAKDVSPDSSFLEMLDRVNEELESRGEEPIAFDHDCREGICGMCSMMINGYPHGLEKGTTACQLHMRHFSDGQTITIEPWRVKPFPIVRDLITDRTAFDRIIQAGGYVSVNTGSAPEANMIPISKEIADAAFDVAACIGCGACAASCPNGSAMLFVSAKVTHLNGLPQGEPELLERTRRMVEQMDAEGFGNCSNHRECEVACPKEIQMRNISKMNRDFIRSSVLSRVFGTNGKS